MLHNYHSDRQQIQGIGRADGRDTQDQRERRVVMVGEGRDQRERRVEIGGEGQGPERKESGDGG